ncbi:hypothetical protein [Cytobacillus praedii]|uniref:hypothetical protein n=2 Tax=Cytobacillus praedii TaxID=1742358 RepID=UPI002E1A276B|nr:hypothetical protein [Cytobacillus praedii]
MATKIMRGILFILTSLVLIGILFYGVLYVISYGISYFIMIDTQGEYRKYDTGVTIEVKNSSQQDISNLKFSFGHLLDINFQEIGEIKQLKPGQSSKLTGKSMDLSSSDLSMYMQYYLKDGETKVENSIFYLDTINPKKVVALIDITKVDDEGNLLLNVEGYNGFTQITGEIDPDRDN